MAIDESKEPGEKLLDGQAARQAGPNAFYNPQDPRIFGWLLESLAEGERVNKSDPMYSKMDKQMAFVMGEQHTGAAPSFLQRVTLNRSEKAILAHVSSLTDLRPVFGYKTENPKYQATGDILNKLTVVWWINNFIDMDLADLLKYSAVLGAGDMVMEYDPAYNGGDTRCFPRDPRDTIPIRPERDRSIQSWEGVTIRQENSINKLKAKYPGVNFHPDTGILGSVFTRLRNFIIGANTGEPPSPIGVIQGRQGRQQQAKITNTVTLNRTFINDLSINPYLTSIVMGQVGTAWAYSVEPGQRLYPQRRMILWWEGGVLYDGPNPYWHGLFPIERLRLKSWPWSFFGKGILSDLMPAQIAINDTVNKMLMNLSQHVERGSIWDKNVSNAEFERFDARKPNFKVKRQTAFSDGMKLAEVATLPQWTMGFLQAMFTEFDSLAGTANLQALLQLRQMPGRETIDKYIEALTPEIRLEGRQLESFLRSMATIVKANIFQFQTKRRRFTILGEQAKTLEDVDYDPGLMVPAMSKEQAEYIPELDKDLDRASRARWFLQQFAFYVTPNSLLAMHAQERKLLHLQLARQGYLDVWTLMEILEIPNFGEPPNVELPDPEDPNRKIFRKPLTITERLIAQQQLGLGQTASNSGRKASGQAPPNLVQKPDGSTTITES